MTLFKWGRAHRRQQDEADVKLEAVVVATRALEKRVERLEADAQVLYIQRQRELHEKGAP
jgi:hypothetical protein